MTRVHGSVFLFFCYLLTCSVEGAKRLSADVWVEAALASRHDVPQSPMELLDLDTNHDLEPVDTFNTVSGTLKIKYQQTYKDVPILGATVVLEQKKDGTFTTDAHGDFIKETEQDITEAKFPKRLSRKLHPDGLNELTEAEALGISLKAFGAQKNEIAQKSSKQIVYLDSNDQAHLAYELTFQITANDTLFIPAYIIDMYSGEVLNTWPMLYSLMSPISTPGGTVNTGKYMYGKNGRPTLMVKNLGDGICNLENDDISVRNYNSGDKLPANAFSFSCCEGIQDEVNGGYGPMADAFYFAGKTLKMHHEWYNMAFYEPKPLIVGVHYGNRVDNGYFMGHAIALGDGLHESYPLSSSINFVAHEVAHGFTSQHSKLIYENQSGGMNEAFSDMTGETVEYYMTGKVDWVFSKSSTKNKLGYRSYKDPPKDGASIGNAKNYYKGIDVHYSSGVYNKAFYLLTNKSGWNIKNAYNVMLLSNKMYWPRDATFCKGLTGSLKAAKDLGFKDADVRDAFRMVGVTTDC